MYTIVVSTVSQRPSVLFLKIHCKCNNGYDTDTQQAINSQKNITMRTFWPIQGAPPAHAPKGPDSFVSTYKFFET